MASEEWSRVQFQEGFLMENFNTNIEYIEFEDTLYVQTPLKII